MWLSNDPHKKVAESSDRESRSNFIGLLSARIVPIRFPPNLMKMRDNWKSCPDENVGWCLVSDCPIRGSQQHSQMLCGSQAGIPFQGSMKVAGIFD
jgi:hypothetical protein